MRLLRYNLFFYLLHRTFSVVSVRQGVRRLKV